MSNGVRSLPTIVSFGADVSEWVPPLVESYLKKKFGGQV